MLLSAVFPQLRGFRLAQIRTDDDDLTVVATSTQRTALCSVCSSLSSDVHSRSQRRLTDLPCAGHAVTQTPQPVQSSGATWIVSDIPGTSRLRNDFVFSDDPPSAASKLCGS